jgi:c-di-GMP-binding flagellar brake protein YcgR
MIYQRYFKAGLKVQLRSRQQSSAGSRNELLSAKIEGGNANHLDLSLPYGPNSVDHYSFKEDMPFELSADALGLGIKVSVNFLEKLGGNKIRVLVLPDLEMFQRRAQPRIDCTLGIRYTRGENSLQKLREIWKKNSAVLASTSSPRPLEGFTPCQLNLSISGIRFAITPPTEIADIYLMLLDLADQKEPICALAEVVWVEQAGPEGTLYAGMQFINILEQDQERIELYISAHPELN